jgi:transposase
MSRRKAAVMFKVSASVAVRWLQRVSETGSCQAKPTGGDKRSQGIEAHQAWLLSQIAEEPDLTLEEIRGRLAAEHSFKASVSMLWRFFRRHGVSFKKNCTPPNRIGPTWPRRVRSGPRSSQRLRFRDLCSLTKLGPARA